MTTKILIINTSYAGGGAANIAREIFQRLLKMPQFDVSFAYGRGKKSSSTNVWKFSFTWESALQLLLVRCLGLEGYGSYFSTRRLIKWIKKEKFQLIHLHNLHGYYLNFFQLFKFLTQEKIPVVWTLHDEWLLNWLPAHSDRYNYPANYLPLCRKYMARKKRAAILSLRPSIVSPAKWLMDKLATSPLQDLPRQLIKNGVNLNIFRPHRDREEWRKKYTADGETKIIIFAADKNKGGEKMQQIAARLIGRPYLFLGLGACQAPERENLKFLGYISDPRALSSVLSSADAYCSLSLAETAPLGILEASASGLMIIASDIPAHRELVTQEMGIIISGDIISQAQAIDAFLKTIKPTEKTEPDDQFSAERMWASYLNLYREKL